MTTIKVSTIYKRFALLGLLTMFLFIVSFTEVSENVSAVNAPCYQDCEDNFRRCLDSCPPSCSSGSTDYDCDDCFTTCDGLYGSCMGVAVSCSKPYSYTPECQFHFGTHCPIINGSPDCNHSSTHSGYYQTCNRPNNTQCVACPGGEYCNNLPSCY